MKYRFREELYPVYKDIILTTLPKSPCNITYHKLSEITGINTRIIRDVIRLMRNEGICIASSTSKGYWITHNMDDIRDTIRLLTAYRDSFNETINALTNSLNNMESEHNEYK